MHWGLALDLGLAGVRPSILGLGPLDLGVRRVIFRSFSYFFGVNYFFLILFIFF